MKKTKLFCSIMLCYSALVMGAAETHETTLEGILRQQPIRATLLPYVPMSDIGKLSRVSRSAHEAVGTAIKTAMEKKIQAANLLYLRQTRWNLNNQAFKDYVIQGIKDFATHNPGIWINLNLQWNHLGDDLEFLRDLLQAIVTTVHSLKIDLAALYLGANNLAKLPERLFEGLGNLRKLDLGSNQLEIVPAAAFDGLMIFKILI